MAAPAGIRAGVTVGRQFTWPVLRGVGRLARLSGIKVPGRTAVIGLASLWLSLTGMIVAAAHNHATWHASYHRTMTQVATPESVIGEFDDVRLVNGEVQLLLEREDDQFMVDLTIQNQGHIARFPIVMTTGSHHMQAYWYFTEVESRTLHLLPFVYLKTEQRWIPRASAFLEQPSGDESPALRTWRTSKGPMELRLYQVPRNARTVSAKLREWLCRLRFDRFDRYSGGGVRYILRVVSRAR